MLSVYENFEKCNSERMVRAAIGINKAQFDVLSVQFEKSYHGIQQERVNSRQIKKLPDGGSGGNLDTLKKKLFFTLFYCKAYTSFDVLGIQFGFSGGNAHDHIGHYLPVLERAFSKLNVLPSQEIKTPQEMQELVEKYDQLIIDCVETPCARPKAGDRQKAYYSGKKNGTHSNR